MGSLYGDVMLVMLLAPLASPAVAFSATETLVFVPPTFHSCSLLAAGLFRVEHQSPFMSLGNAARCLTPASLHVNHHMRLGAPLYPRSRVNTNRVQFPMWPWLYSVLENYRRKPWMAAMPTDSSRTYQAMISMMWQADARCLSGRQVARYTPQRDGSRWQANGLGR